MKMPTIRHVLLAVCVLALASGALGQAANVGQSRTLLPDGRVLLLGGFDAQKAPTQDAFMAETNGPAQKLATGLITARAGHTATVLPDGTVFIFGGIGSDGRIVGSAELFDPRTGQFSVLQDVLAVPRAFHTATLLTDGTVLLAGGVLAGGQFPEDVQLLDWRTKKALSFEALLMTPREGHIAALLSDGTVRITGGTDRFGRPVAADEIFDPVTEHFRFAGSSETQDDTSLRIAASIPEDGAAEVGIQTSVALRFTKLLDVTSAIQQNFVLTGPDQAIIPATVAAVEAGRVVFVVPTAPLRPGTTYQLLIKGARDTTGTALPATLITFATEGEAAEGTGPDWAPNATWTDNTGTTKFQGLPPLQARPGTTALAGQVLKLDGWPLQHVTLEMEGNKVRTDATGRFLLTGLTAGHHVLWIDGSTANHADSSYGVYEVGVTILPGKTNVLNYTIWMTRLDMAHVVNIPSPTTKEMVIINPSIPGLELHLPAGAVITDRFGKIVRQVSITPVPLNKPPFPLPGGVQVPIYFTIQPGGAYISVKNPGNSPAGARLFYPNAFHFSPGSAFEFWNYDADVKGWFVYGKGTVSADGHSVVPNPGVVIYEFTGAMVADPSGAGGQACLAGECSTRSDPVSLQTGQFIYNKTDLALPDIIPIEVNRTYVSNDSHVRSFGIGATLSYDMFMIGDRFPYTYQELVLPNGARIRFDRTSTGTDYTNAVYVHTSSRTRFYGAVLSWDPNMGLPGPWVMRLRDGTIYNFHDSAPGYPPYCGGVYQIQDRNGNVITLTRTPMDQTQLQSTWCLLTKITGPSGRSITLTRDSQDRITQAQDSSGRTVLYTYDAAGRLSTVTDAGNGVTTYTYDDSNRMLSITDPRGILYLTNQYDSSGRVIQQTEADNGTYQFAWTPTANTDQTHFYEGFAPSASGSDFLLSGCWDGMRYDRNSSNCGEGYLPLMGQVDVTDPRGYVERVVFNNNGYITSDTRALGQPEEQTVSYTYYNENLLKSATDALGRVASFDYDGEGNTTRITRLDGTPNAVTTTFSYEPYFNQLSSQTDPLNHTSTLTYDALGNLATAVDPLNHQTIFGHNGYGQLTLVQDALNNTIGFSYFGGDMVSVTDPLGNVSATNYDRGGRITGTLDAQGNLTQFQYNNFNLLTQSTDPKAGITGFSYDPNGNLLSLTDALNHTTTWTYDNMDRVATRTDPLLRQESFSYDLMGNLVSHTDRKGQVTTFSYDPLNRLTFIGYNTVVNAGVTSYESTVSYTYDAGNRLTQAVDSAGGTITEAYDDLDRLTSETTAQGSISYGYDAAGRRTSMTVTGQPQVTYSYDNADRLTQIEQGTSTVGFGYDNANRRTSLTLSNGVNISYSYDNDSRVTGINYNFGANALGNLTYSYDSLGRRIGVGGSFAQTGFPSPTASAIYDGANELTNWNGTTISYDLNGNMLSDGTNAFTWNARNQAASLNGRNLQYDAFGRRIQNSLGTAFLYDGSNVAQELSGGTATANLLSGGIDEWFSRIDSSGALTALQDALGSTIALVDANGNLSTQYSYDPFGSTTSSGVASSNLSQYTGRENEGNGLYYYRARYYSPVLHRFVSQDPLGMAGSGVNLYTYVTNSPTNFIDSFGLNVATGPITATNPTAVEVEKTLQSVQRATQAAEGAAAAEGTAAAGEGAAAGGGSALCASTVVCGLVVLDAGLAVNDGIDLYHLGQAYGWWAQHRPNGKPNGAPSLAGRYTRPRYPRGGGNDDDDCRKQWSRAREFCSEVNAIPRNSDEWKDYEEVWGGSYDRCVRGQVEQRCGGNRI